MNTTAAVTDLLVVDDHLLLAQGLVAALAARGVDQSVVIDPVQVDVLQAIDTYQPSIVLLDIDFGDNGYAGLALVAEIVGRGCRVIMFTGSNDEALYGACLDLGAESVLRKSVALDAVVDDLQTAVKGGEIGSDAERFSWYRAFRTHKIDRARELAPFESLTPRERDVLARLVDGLTVEEIAEVSFVAVSTIRSQVRSIFQKLDVHSQLAAVALARRAEWQPPHTN
jgi:DNA-binding NarL/FixJ family response regulator